MHQTRHDLEFMARCLYGDNKGVPLHLIAAVFDDVLSGIVERGMADPIANACAQRRISALRRALPDRSVAFPRMGRTIRDEYHRKAGHVDSGTPPGDDPGPAPTRGDLEFMADCLGTVARRTVDGLLPTWLLAKQVAEHMRDPAANARAQGRIAAMLYALPHNECIQKAFALPPDRQRPAPKPWKTEANPWNVVAITPAT